MAPQMWVLRAIMAFEDRIIASILRQPAFHHLVRRIHRAIHEKRYGPSPHHPLAPGEATAEPNPRSGFFKHFRAEIRNQFRARPTDLSKKPPE
ncbi:hypothetical protein G6O67_004488 [Ophiocordyceps sinensis]|uniref:Uncharacterized protein n=1 Tax=Ophiocordyceps sinensis TaxID=72228 RepID=A0A8H4V4V8_9HYPO|nr:hypothetical protein G6O67_004488 [Ophiocordyceps sinensis]